MKTIELDEEHALAIFWFLGHFQDGDDDVDEVADIGLPPGGRK